MKILYFISIILINSFAQQWGLLPFYTGIPHDGCYEFIAESAFLLGGDCYGSINGGFYQMNYFTNEGYYGLNASFNCNSDCEQCEYVFNDIDIGAGNCETMGNISFMGDYAYFPLLNPSSCYGYYFIAYFGEDSSCHVSHLSMVTGYEYYTCYEPGKVSFSSDAQEFTVEIKFCNTNMLKESHPIEKCVYSSFAEGYVTFFIDYININYQNLSEIPIPHQKHEGLIIETSFGLFAILLVFGISIWAVLRQHKKRNNLNSTNESSPLLQGLDNLDILFRFVKEKVIKRPT